MPSNTHKYLLTIGPVISALAFISIILNFTTVELGSGTGEGEDIFKRHVFAMLFFALGGIMTTTGLVMFLVKKFGDGKILNETAEKLGGKKYIHNETIHGHKVDIGGDVTNTNVTVGSNMNVNQPVVPKSIKGVTEASAQEKVAFSRQLHELIGSGKVKEGIELLREHFLQHNNTSGVRDTVALLRRVNDIERQFHTNGVNTFEMLQERNKIDQTLLALIEKELK